MRVDIGNNAAVFANSDLERKNVTKTLFFFELKDTNEH
jgi:hypothetical protein